MNYATIKYNDIANGDGVRTSLFVSGCPHHCKGCFNEIAWDYNYGEEFTTEVSIKILQSIAPKYISGLSILGGEPLCIDNIFGVTYLVSAFRMLYNDKKSIWIYTGYTLEELKNIMNDGSTKYKVFYKYIMNNIDVLVDGRFEEDKKDISLKFKGSTNQRIIDMKETIKQNKIILYYDEENK